MNIRQQFDELETTEEKRLFVLNHITDENYKRILQFKKISLSTIEIALSVFLNEKIVLREINPNIYNDRKTL